MKEFIAEKNGKLTDAVIDKIYGTNYNSVMKLLRKKEIKVNGVRVKSDIKLSVGDKVTVYLKDMTDMFFSVLYKDRNVLVVCKKSGILSEDVFNKIKEEYGEAYFIHRLDRNTAGVMIFAFNAVSEKELLSGFKNHAFIKEYRAEVIGKMEKKEDVLTAYLKKDAEKSEVKIYSGSVKGSSEIKTGYKVISETEETSILSVRIWTGKTHQIRAHLAYIGHPIVGDGKYGDAEFNKKAGATRQRLTAERLTLRFSADSPLYYLDGKTFATGE